MITVTGIIAMLGAGFALFAGPLALAAFIFWVWMLVHCIRNDRLDGTRRVLWALVIWFLPVIGSIIYFFAGREGSRS